MKKAFAPQQQQHLSLLVGGDNSVVLGDGSNEESVEKKKNQEERRKKKILIVDDEPDITFTLRTVLEENGFKEVDAYNEPLLALQNFKSDVYNLLITDVAMPRVDGFELYEQIKKIDDRIKVILVTASEVNYEILRELPPIDQPDMHDDEDNTAILRDNREGDKERIHFIRKPVEIKEFIQRVNQELQTTMSHHVERDRSSQV
jgi:CheY-like chemotaxis protein